MKNQHFQKSGSIATGMCIAMFVWAQFAVAQRDPSLSEQEKQRLGDQPAQETPPIATPVNLASAIPGPVAGTRFSEDYVRRVGAVAYLWGWPMVNMHNRKLILSKLPEPGLMGGIVAVAPMNQLSMVHDYIDPGERLVACPNQDVVYGFGLFSLDQEPVVVQVPDFGDRFWVYQVVDQRTDSFVQLGKMYGTKPGFYLLTGPDWNGAVPSGIAGVFHSKTNLGAVIPRVFMDDTAADRQAIQPLLKGILMYPLSKFTGQTDTDQGLDEGSQLPQHLHRLGRNQMGAA